MVIGILSIVLLEHLIRAMLKVNTRVQRVNKTPQRGR